MSMAPPEILFEPGDQIRIRTGDPTGHCRTPYYLRGKPGVVESVAGTYRDPEKLAYHKPGLPARVLYRIRFAQADVWPTYKGPTCDTLVADIFDHWLEERS